MPRRLLNTAEGQKPPSEVLKYIRSVRADNFEAFPESSLCGALRALLREGRDEAVGAARHVLESFPNSARKLKNMAGEFLRKRDSRKRAAAMAASD